MKIVIGALLVIILGAGIWYVATNPENEQSVMTNDSAADQVEQDQIEIETQEQSFSGSSSLKNLFSRGQELKCNFTVTEDIGTSAGTFFTDGERFSTVANHTYEGAPLETRMINDGTYMYVWGDTVEGKMAVKMKTLEFSGDETISENEASRPDYVDLDQKVSYDCESWQVDASLFVPPVDIEFEDMDAMMQAAMESMPAGFEMPEGFEIPR